MPVLPSKDVVGICGPISVPVARAIFGKTFARMGKAWQSSRSFDDRRHQRTIAGDDRMGGKRPPGNRVDAGGDDHLSAVVQPVCRKRLPAKVSQWDVWGGAVIRSKHSLKSFWPTASNSRSTPWTSEINRDFCEFLSIPESPFDGEATKELRRVTTAEGLRFFELRVPIVLSREAARLTTDNIFDILAGFRSDESEQTSYTRELPFQATADYYDFLDLLLRNDLSQTEITRLTTRGKNYSQFVRLLASIERAEALNTRVLLD